MRQFAVLALTFLGSVLAITGSGLATFYVGTLHIWGVTLAGLGALVLAISLYFGKDIELLTFVVASGGKDYGRLRGFPILKILGGLLNFALLFGLSTLVLIVLSRVQDPRATLAGSPQAILAMATSLVLGPLIGMTHYQALKTQTPRNLNQLGNTIASLIPFLVLVIAIGTAGLFFNPFTFTTGIFTIHDGPIVILAGYVLVGGLAYVVRSLPNLYSLFSSPKVKRSRASKVVPLPAVLSVVLLLFLVPLMLVSGLVEVPEVPGLTTEIIIGLTLGLGLLLLFGAGLGYVVLGHREKPAVFRTKTKRETRIGRWILYSSLFLGSILATISFLLFTNTEFLGLGQAQWVDTMATAFLAFTGPYGFYVAYRQRRVRRLEEQFPDLLRDIAASRRAGLTLPAAVYHASKGDYGALNPEVWKMSAQLDWNVPFHEVLRFFGERVRTPLVERAVALINEATFLGGSVSDVLMAAAREVREIKNLENERRVTMLIYTAIIYIAFLVFLTVVVVLYGSLIPSLLEAGSAAADQGSRFVQGALDLSAYRDFYFITAVVQATGNGMLAGLIGTGSLLSGLRHAFVMVLIAFVTFTVFLG